MQLQLIGIQPFLRLSLINIPIQGQTLAHLLSISFLLTAVNQCQKTDKNIFQPHMS